MPETPLQPPEPMPVVSRPTPPPPSWQPPTPPVITAQVLPQPLVTPQVSAPRKPMRMRVVALITLGAVVALSAVVVAAVGLGTLATSALDDLGPIIAEQSGIEPLAEGEAGSPYARAPLDCDGNCFTDEVIAELVPSAREFATLGLPTLSYVWGEYDTTRPGDEWFYTSQTWEDEGGSPMECSFTLSVSPISNSADDQPIKVERDDTIEYIGEHTTEDYYSSLVQTVRVFRSSDHAVEHMEETSTNITNCSRYSFGAASDYTGGVVTPEPELVLPDSVAAVGWVETNHFGRYYVVDVQRGNVVTRSTLYTDGAVTEGDFRAFLESSAGILASIPLPTA